MSSHRIFENTWTMTGLTYDMTDGLLAWKDGIGARVAAAAGALHPNASDNLFAGAHREPSAATECLTGDMEAVLISFEKKSSAYIKAWSDTWSDSNTFYSAGAMETRRCEVPKNGCGRVGFD
jgi:hypothetical protein